MTFRHLGCLLCIGLFLFSSCDRESQQLVEMTGAALGTTYSIKFSAHSSQKSTEALHTGIKSVIEQVDRSMSVHRQESEISRFNRSTELKWFEVSEPLFDVITQSQQISEASNGAFDITIGRLIELWGFGVSEAMQGMPSPADIQSALHASGYEHLELSPDKKAIRKTRSDLILNLSAIAKGYAVDRVSVFLETQGISSYLVEIGGEIRTKGSKAGQNPWLVAIERPEISKRSIYKIVELSDLSMATSGDYRNFYEINGKRYSHTIDPSTGRPVENRVASVTVIHPSCMVSDALATTLAVKGYEQGKRFADEQGYAVLWILRNPDGIEEKLSNHFNRDLFH